MAPGTTPRNLIEELAPLCRKHGIKRIKVADIEIEFGAENVDPAALKDFQRILDKGVPTDEEVLGWSAPGFVPREDTDMGKLTSAPLARVTRSARRK